jgi:thioesterase III
LVGEYQAGRSQTDITPVISRHPRRPLSGIHGSQRKAWIPAQKRRGNDVLWGSYFFKTIKILEVRKNTMSHSIIQIKIRGFHVDAFGVVNHAWFIRFFEEARWAYLDERPELGDGLKSAGIAHSVVSLHVEYQLPVRLGNLLGIRTRVARAGQRSIAFEQEADIMPGQETAVIAQVTNVFFLARGGEVVEVNNEVFDSWPELRELSENSLLDKKSV